MTAGIVDSTVIIHLLRNNPLAIEWINARPQRLGVTTITWLEVMSGASGKARQSRAESALAEFELSFPNRDDQLWAMDQLKRHRLSRGVAINDSLIASVCYRLKVPIFTHNRKDFLKLLPARLVISPY